MKGIILNVLEELVVDAHGEAAWDELLRDAGVVGAYTAVGDYPDAEVAALVEALARRTGRDVPSALRWIGRGALPRLLARYPRFAGPADPVAFVLTLDAVIHDEVVKLHPRARPPALSFSDVSPAGALPRTVTVTYRSDRALGDLAVGFLHGTADHYDHVLDLDVEPVGADGRHVRLRCRFSPDGP